MDTHFVEEAGESAVNQVDQVGRVDQVVDLGSEEEETEVGENQCSDGDGFGDNGGDEVN